MTMAMIRIEQYMRQWRRNRPVSMHRSNFLTTVPIFFNRCAAAPTDATDFDNVRNVSTTLLDSEI